MFRPTEAWQYPVFHWLSMLLGLAALVAIGLGVWTYLGDTSESPTYLSLEQPERDIGAIPVGEERCLEFRIHNTYERPLYVHGLTGEVGCGPAWCFEGKQEWPLTVPAYGSAVVQLTLKFNRPVPFEETFGLRVVDALVTRVLPISIRGRGFQPAGAADHR